MTSAVVGGLGEKVAERWTAALFGPATLFWVVGLVAWFVDERDWEKSGDHLVEWFDSLSGTEQVLVAIGALLVLVALDVLVRQFTFPVLQFLEGYRLLWRVGWLTDYQAWRLARARNKLVFLESQEPSSLLPKQQHLRSKLAAKVRRYPEVPALLMPTPLGNVLRAAETWPRDKYGLDAVACWPRLWLVLDEDERSEISKAQQALDQTIVLFIWGVLVVVWVFLTPLVLLVTLATCAFACWWAAQRARALGDLVEAAFDVHRGKLYDALRFKRPVRPADEPAWGLRVSTYLWYRRTSNALEFVDEASSDDNDKPKE